MVHEAGGGIYRRTAIRAAGATLLGGAAIAGGGTAAAQPRTRTRLTTVDTEQTGDAPADVATVSRRGHSFALIANHDADEVRSYRLDRNGNLTRVDAAEVGDAPAGLAVTRRGFVVAANTLSNDLSVLRLDRRGRLRRVGSAPAGRGPSAVAVDERRGFVVAVNRDSDELIAYHLDRRGNLTETHRSPVGDAPEAVDVSRHGFVAVANAGSNDVSGFWLHPSAGRLIHLATVEAGFFPRAVAFTPNGRQLYVATATGSRDQQNQIIDVRADSTGVSRSRVNAGFGLTDVAVGRQHVYAASATPQGEDQLLAFDRRGDRLNRSGMERFGAGFSLRNLAVARERGTEFVLVTSFNRNETRSIRVD